MIAERPKAYSYIRMSTDVQLKGDSLRRQQELSRRYAQEHDLDLVESEELHDIGVSAYKGANLESEAALGRFLNAVREKRIAEGSYLLVESLDRISRREVTQSLGTFLQILASNITIVTISDQQVYRPGETHDLQLFGSLLIMSRAHEESLTKSRRLSAAWKNKRDRIDSRKLTRQAPAWLELSDDKTVFFVRQDRAEIVRRIFEESASGIGNFSIARRLNEDGIPTFGRSNGWQISYINKILCNRAAVGDFQPHRLIDGRREPEGETIPGYFPAIVDEELYLRAQQSRSQRRVGGVGTGRRGAFISNLFSGLAHCAYCGSRMTFLNKGTLPKGGTYLVCDAARRGMGCQKTLWRYPQFEASFLSFVEELDLAPLVRSEDEVQKRAELDKAIAALEGQRLTLERRRNLTFELLDGSTGTTVKFVSGKLEEMAKALAEVESQLAAKRAEREAFQAEVARFYEGRDQIKGLIARLRDTGDAEVYKLRALIAARLKSLVSKLVVAAAGEVPLERRTVSELEAHLASIQDKDETLERALVQLRSDVERDQSARRYLQVLFKDGTQPQPSPVPIEMRDCASIDLT